MLLTNEQYDAIMRTYDERQAINREAAELRRQEVYAAYPELDRLDEEISSFAVSQAEKLMDGDAHALEELKEKVSALRETRRKILAKAGVEHEDFTPSYICPDCRDTGFIGSERCHCFRQAEIDLIYTQSNIKKILEKENFDHYTTDYYSKEPWGDSEKSPYEVAKAAESFCRGFVASFDTEFQNILFYGDTGVGKTFLSNCVAKALLDRGRSVIYFTAPQLFDIFEKDVFHKNRQAEDIFRSETGAEKRRNIYDADLLIIDDLGTEMINSFTVSQLYTCLNERILRERSTIISTNLMIRQLPDLYSMRIFSRLSSQYTFIRLIGEDIRVQKHIG